jgi:hypothetical protein
MSQRQRQRLFSRLKNPSITKRPERVLLVRACAAVAERLEPRRLLAVATTYVDDNWFLLTDTGTPGASVGDTVRNDFDTINTAGITATYGVDGFGTVAAVPSSAPGAATIQDAVNNTNANGTVNVLEGGYALTGDIGINSGVTLRGPNSAISPNTGSRVAEAVINGGDTQRIRVSTTDPVSLEGLQLSHLVLDSYTADSQITYQKNIIDHMPGNIFLNEPATWTLSDNHIYGTADDWDDALIAGDWNGATGTMVNIQNNVIENLSTASTSSGLNLSNVAGTIAGNTFKTKDFYALLLANNSGVTVSGNIFDNIYNSTGFPSYGALRFYTPGTVNVSITTNQFTNSYAGIAVRQGSVTTGATIGISGNTFTNDTYDIINLGNGGLTPAGDNVFDGVTLSAATTPQLFAIADKVVDAVDVPDAGLVRLKANNIYVTPNSYFAAPPPNTATATPSIQRGINAASNLDTVNVAAGFYGGETVAVNKTVTLLGAQAGVDARTRGVVPESIVSNGDGDFQIEANNVTIDGFRLIGVVNDPNSPPFTGLGAAIWTNPGFSGTNGGHKIFNNIIDGNVSGIELDSDGSIPTIVEQNLIQNNNASGAASGNGIIVSFGLVNAFIDSNTFVNNSNGGIGFQAAEQDVTISNNSFTANGNGVYAYNLADSVITQNNFDSQLSSQVGLFGGDTNVEVTNNVITNGATNGIRIGDFFGPNNTDLTIEMNSITNNNNGILVDNVPDAPYSIMCNTISGNVTSGLTNSDPNLLIAEKNYWGSPTGPMAPSNPSGTGDKVIGNVDFTPWAADPSCTTFVPPSPLVTTEQDPCDPTCTALLVIGTDAADQITVKLGDSSHPNDYQVTIKNSSGTTTVKGTAGPDPLCRVIIYGLDGNDAITMDSHGRNIPVWEFGGNGNDKLTGSKGPDVLVGEAGNDTATGNEGRDLLIGGTGADNLNGGKGEDIVIGGNTDHDSDLNALCKIMDEWTRTDANFATRVNHLKGTTPNGLNSPYFLNPSTVHNDGVKDVLSGGSGSDWFIYDSSDKLADFKANQDIKTEV